ncbi:MAG: aldo/keto reductase [Clostridium sp.]|uniref:aldo/keto reductase n=1 Tax=Clostridium sp. TaxID=1506 RepID=UPI003D6CC152
MNIKGFATLEGTKNYFTNRNVDSFLIRNTEWFYSLPIAIGTHLGNFSDEHSELYMDCLTYGLEKEINFIDTAVNYRGMRSEKDIGKVLNILINEKNALKREEIIISTKGGQIFGDIDLGITPLDYLDKILIVNGILERNDVNIVENHRHTLAPEFYEFSIEQSKKNLGIETIDIHYIHNPEISMYVLGKDLFYKKLEKLIEFYEEQVEIGSIKSYGMATWDAFLADMHSKYYISIKTVMDMVKAVAGEKHHFKFIQLPYNKKNNLASTKKNQNVKGKYYTPIQAANELGINVTISSPLNQGEEFNKSYLSSKELLKYVIDTEGVYAAMVGTKRREHLEENIAAIEEIVSEI